MKVMRVLDKKIGSTIYYKYRINLPKEMVEELKLEGKKLKFLVQNNKIVIEKEN